MFTFRSYICSRAVPARWPRYFMTAYLKSAISCAIQRFLHEQFDELLHGGRMERLEERVIF